MVQGSAYAESWTCIIYMNNFNFMIGKYKLPNKKIIFFNYLLSIIFFTSALTAQNKINFNHLNVKNGLSQSSVTVIFQDKRGFMWFGTQDGLNRYDGYNFKVFRNNPSDTTTLYENFIFSIYENQSGTLYIETQGGILHRYNPKTESFIKINKDSVNLTSAKISSVGAIFEEQGGIRWTGGLGKPIGLNRLDVKTGKTFEYRNDPSDPSSLSDDKVYSILKDRSGRLWVGTMNGLDLLDEKTGKFTHYRNNPTDPFSIPDNWVWPIFEDSKGRLWIGTVRGGLSLFNPETGTFINYRNQPSEPGSIGDNFIFSIYEDRSGVIWVGTNTGGVSYFHPSSQTFEHYTHQPSGNSLSDNNIMSLLVDKRGTYWIGTRSGGLDKFDYNKKKFKNYPFNAVQYILEDRSGNLWLGTFSSGLAVFNPYTENIKYYINDPSDSLTISDNRILSLYEDAEGLIWIGTYGGGLNRFDPSTGIFTRFQNEENNTNSISSNNVWSSVVEDKSGKLWIGTYGGGVNIFDKTKNTFINLRNNPSDSASIIDDNIIRIIKDNKENIWFGTSRGLSRYMGNSKFKNYTVEDGLANDFIFGILEDNKERLWISTNNGLSRFNPKDETFKNYFEHDGLQGNEFNQNAFAKDYRTGHLVFGGTGGFNIFHPDSLGENNYPPPVVLTEYLRFNTDDEEGKPIFEKGISETDSIILTYKDNIITIEFAALSYYNNFQNMYRYKLEGFNENWIQLGTSHNVTFTNLSPGEYTLKVAGSNNDGVWNHEGVSLFIEVLPPWWRTNIVYAGYGFIFFSVLYGLRRFEINRREQKAHLRETELRMKATEAEKRVIEAENERKTKELEEARQLQLSMLPRELPQLANLEIAAFMRTATEVGGDYYDFICQQNGVLNVAFGDATGHGLQAGTMVTLMKGFFTSDAAKLEPQDFMNHCSNMIKEIKLGRILMSFSFLRITESRLSITSGGMPPVYYYDQQLNETEEILIQGMPLGAMRKYNYKRIDKEIKSGDTILLLSDGLPEQMNNKDEMFNYARVKEKFNEFAPLSAEKIINELIKSGDQWMEDAVQADDITMVVIKVK
jgi:ligand-binding sensor domain-containing protein/serine phosphatase RsbU (regulator of sigma subunit)